MAEEQNAVTEQAPADLAATRQLRAIADERQSPG
jgi:hypothetical protein